MDEDLKLIRQIVAGKQNRTFVAVLAPVVNIPVELEKLFVVIEHGLPDDTSSAASADKKKEDDKGG